MHARVGVRGPCLLGFGDGGDQVSAAHVLFGGYVSHVSRRGSMLRGLTVSSGAAITEGRASPGYLQSQTIHPEPYSEPHRNTCYFLGCLMIQGKAVEYCGLNLATMGKNKRM